MEHIENRARDNKEKQLEGEVEGMEPDDREKYLAKVADEYLVNRGYDMPLIIPD